MPYRMNTHERVERLTDAAILLIETEGVGALTLRRLAAVMRLSPSTLVSHLTDRNRMVDLATKTLGARLVQSIELLARRDGMYAFVSDDEEHLRLVRAWLALSEVARADSRLWGGPAATDAELRELLALCTRVHAGDALTLDTLVAAITGLWAAQCAAHHPIPAARARAVLRYLCAALEIDAAPKPREGRGLNRVAIVGRRT